MKKMLLTLVGGLLVIGLNAEMGRRARLMALGTEAISDCNHERGPPCNSLVLDTIEDHSDCRWIAQNCQMIQRKITRGLHSGTVLDRPLDGPPAAGLVCRRQDKPDTEGSTGIVQWPRATQGLTHQSDCFWRQTCQGKVFPENPTWLKEGLCPATPTS